MQTSVSELAADLKMPAAVLLDQLRQAGINKSELSSPLSDSDLSRLLEFLRRSLSKSRPGQIAVGKKRILVRRDAAELRSEASSHVSPMIPFRARTVRKQVGVRGGALPPPVRRSIQVIASHGPTSMAADMFRKTPQHAEEDALRRLISILEKTP